MYRQHSALHHHFGVARVALVQVEMMRAEAVKEELVKFVFLGKVLDARLLRSSLVLLPFLCR